MILSRYSIISFSSLVLGIRELISNSASVAQKSVMKVNLPDPKDVFLGGVELPGWSLPPWLFFCLFREELLGDRSFPGQSLLIFDATTFQ